MGDRRGVSLGITRGGLLTVETKFQDAEWSVMSLPVQPEDRKRVVDRCLALCVTTGLDEARTYVNEPHKACVFAHTDKTYRVVQREAGTVPTNALMLLDVIRADGDVQEYFFVLLPETYRTLCRLLSSINAPLARVTGISDIMRLELDAPFAVIGIVDAMSRVKTTPPS